LVSTLTGLLTGGTMVALLRGVVYYRKGMSEVAQKERASVEAEWARQIDRLNAEINRLNGVIDRLQNEGMERARKIADLVLDNAKCQSETSKIRAQTYVLNFQVRHLTKALGQGDPFPAFPETGESDSPPTETDSYHP
jgi:hypothetical protein